MNGTMNRLCLIALCLAAASLGACSEQTPPPVPPRPVVAMNIVPITTELFGPFAGTVQARYQTDIGFQTSGRIIARDAYVGDRVEEGQRLAALDPTTAQFALIRAKADVANAAAQLENAEGIAGRQRTLTAEGSTSQAALDEAIARSETAKARLDQAQAALRVAAHQIGYTELTASFEGVVTNWAAEVGQYVNEGQAIVTVAHSDSRDAVIDIPDDLMGHVAEAMEFTVRLQASPSVTASAHVREIAPLADPATRSHRIRLTLQNPSQVFRIGATVTVEKQNPISPKILVPVDAVVDGEADRYVWVLNAKGNRVTRRKVDLAGTEDGNVVVKSGLAAGDRVVTVGIHSLEDGQTVAGEAGTIGKAGATQL
jgi:membrane fusion protein, multidrug efflux system